MPLIPLVEALKKSNNLTVPHKGIVVDNNDPAKIGRVRVTIDDLYTGDIDNLPWVYCLGPAFLGGSNNSSSFAVPEIGSELVIIFPFNTIYMPFYVGYWISATTIHQFFNGADYPNIYGSVDSAGNSLVVNKVTGDITITSKSGTTIVLKGNGEVDIHAEGLLYINVEGDISITSKGSVDVTSQGPVTVSALGQMTAKGVVNMDSFCPITGTHLQGTASLLSTD